MAGVNKATIIGRLGRDPEVRYTPDGTAMANFSVATSEEWKDKNTGEQRERTEWHRVVFFGGLAEVVQQYMRKGGTMYVEGAFMAFGDFGEPNVNEAWSENAVIFPLDGSQAAIAVPDFERLCDFLQAMDSGLGGTLSAFEVLWKSFYDLVADADQRRITRISRNLHLAGALQIV